MLTRSFQSGNKKAKPGRKMLSTLLYDLRAAMDTLPPAVVLPEQFYPSPNPQHGEQGEVALRQAVLADALLCFQKYAFSQRRTGQRLYREAKEWIFSDEQRWPFSFVNVCAALNLDPDYVRLLLERWQQRVKAGTIPPFSRPSVRIAA